MTPDDLRTLLDRAGLPSGYAAAPVLGVPMRTVQHWLSGERSISAQAAELVCIVLVAEQYVPAGGWMRQWVRPSVRALVGVS
jgi:DNA-binding transcriptional regulator YiaG